jgi:hypothetical protein
VANLAVNGLQAKPLLLGLPRWFASTPAKQSFYRGWRRQAWSSFVTEIAARYGPNGTFWRDNPALPQMPLTDWEVWNEPNLSGYWGGRPNPRRYVRLLRITGAAIHVADPSARIGIGGIFPPPRPRYGVSLRNFVNGVYRVHGARSTFDALSIHPYASRPGGVIGYLREARRLMNSHHDRAASIWITELGWSTGGVRWRTSPFRATEPKQAKYLSASFRKLVALRTKLRLEQLIWHGWQDSNYPGAPWTLHMGLIRSDGSAKPSLSAYRGIAR